MKSSRGEVIPGFGENVFFFFKVTPRIGLELSRNLPSDDSTLFSLGVAMETLGENVVFVSVVDFPDACKPNRVPEQ